MQYFRKCGATGISFHKIKKGKKEFGTYKGDHCLVAGFCGKVVGAVWTRIMDDYGHVDEDTPSFAISLYKECRSQGIGAQLMLKMLELLKRQAIFTMLKDLSCEEGK